MIVPASPETHGHYSLSAGGALEVAPRRVHEKPGGAHGNDGTVGTRAWLFAMTACSCRRKRSKTVWDGVYSDAQAGRGKRAYIDNCASCHKEGLQGGDLAPELKGESFLLRWNDKSMLELVDRIAEDDAAGQPGGADPQVNADIIAYVLQVNKMAAGSADLPTDAAALKAITITKSK